jgi:predicted enzyme related to lactoylglutathione lyase
MSDDGMIVWNEVNTLDAKKACEFYGSLFAWVKSIPDRKAAKRS